MEQHVKLESVGPQPGGPDPGSSGKGEQVGFSSGFALAQN